MAEVAIARDENIAEAIRQASQRLALDESLCGKLVALKPIKRA